MRHSRALTRAFELKQEWRQLEASTAGFSVSGGSFEATRNAGVDRTGRVFSALMWAIFALDIALGVLAPETVLDSPSDVYRFVNFASWGVAVALVALGFVESARSRRRWPTTLQPIAAFVLLTFLALILGVIFEVPDLAGGVRNDVLPYVSAVLAPLSATNPRIRARFVSAISIQIPIAGLYALYVILARPVVYRSDFTYAHYHAVFLLMPLAFVFPLLNELSRWKQVASMGALAAMVVLNVFGQNRLAVANFLVVVPVGAFVLMSGSKGSGRRTIGVIATGLALAAVAFQFIPQSDDLLSAWSATVQRVFGVETLTEARGEGLGEMLNTEYSQARGLEAEDFIASAPGHVWLIGAGAGGVWQSGMRGTEWPMVHLGPLHMVLRGGLLYAGLFLFLNLAAIGRAWRHRARNSVAAGALLFLTVWVLGFLAHGPMAPGYGAFTFWTVLGLAHTGDPSTGDS
jgi:hypothetical protein